MSIARTSRAVVVLGDGGWEIRDLPVPEAPLPGGAILRVEAVGMCHSDTDNLNGIVHTPWGGEFPTIPGHEVVGRVEQLGDGSADAMGVEEGDRVAVRSGRTTNENKTRIYGHDYSIDEGSGLYGGFADYMELLPGSGVIRLPDEVPATELTVWEPLSIALGWAAPVVAGDTVAVLGPGHLGLAAIVAAQANGAERIAVTGTSADGFRLDAARQLGAELTVDVDAQDPVETVLEMTDGKGADVVIDAAAGTTRTVVQAMEMVRRGGKVVIGGVKERKPVDGFISDWIPLRNITVMPGIPGDHARGAVDLIWEGKVPTRALLGEVFALENVGEAFDLMERKISDRDAIRVSLRLV
jgi:threonine dehydrogenase-like Zn-dependent dehydrogenase